ncbi:hypothetical protein NL108_005331 [Boleophthalmus pectinirostris]|nr:hypothetical protein NL108_005331 [Boleophthalmus pectinirostris]
MKIMKRALFIITCTVDLQTPWTCSRGVLSDHSSTPAPFLLSCYSLQNENISHLVQGSKVNSQADLVEIQVVGRDTSSAHRNSNCLRAPFCERQLSKCFMRPS